MIAFYGMGLLGSNFVRALRRRGETVHVWNRNPERAKALAADGAIAFADAAEAARGAERLHLTLSDDAAVDAVLEAARAGIGPHAIVVDHTTTSPAGTRARAERWAARGVAFQHAPVFMGPTNARDGTGIMLASGDRARFDLLEPALAPMTGKLVYLGPEPDRAAAIKLFGNMFMMIMTTGLVEVLALAKALGVPQDEATKMFDWLNPGATLGVRMKRITDAAFSQPSWELAMARKDLRLMEEAAAAGNVALEMVPALAAWADRWIERGHGHDDWTIIAKDAL
jgi:3-hydroxyisobutyrate dehydrogenase